MLATVPASNEFQGKKRLLKKANRLSSPFKEDFVVVMEGDARPPEVPKTPSSQPETITTEKLAGWSSPQVHESLDARRSSSISGQSLFTIEDPSTTTSSEAGSQYALTSTEHLRRGKSSRLNRQLEENIPPAQTKRRQSFDISARTPSPGDLKRSQSLWGSQKRREVSDDAAGEFQDRYLRNFGTGTMSERQRALNVKRARKMTQVGCYLPKLDSSNLFFQLFGQEPPSELIQIHDEREEIDHFRDSTATLSTFLAVTPPLRDRANSTSSTGTVANEVEVDVEVPSTPPPFSTVHAVDDTPEPSTSPALTNFQERRRRAAKLSRFFGVGFQDILLSPAPEAAPIPETRVEVDVKVGGRRFWSFSDRPKDGGDMQEAIQKLRGLKAG
ncbi:hypothetical protein B0H19DRAFT_1125804 [Mycena capillaripes]|nr:hypothetical protein B0H19DRAFT_1125804 [Mycena capillaripes]